MLSRIAESFYWIGRYIERINSAASLLDVTYLSMTEGGPDKAGSNIWESLIAVTQGLEFFRQFHEQADEETVHSFLIFSRDNSSSVFSALYAVRENLRGVRNRISNSLWLVTNEFYMELQKKNLSHVLCFDRSRFYRLIKDFCLTFYGVADNTLMHDEAWQFLKLGRAIERSIETGHLLDLKYHILLPSLDEVEKPFDIHQWQILLRSVDGLEPYVNTYANHITPVQVAELLVLNRQFPKSIIFNVKQMERFLFRVPHRSDSIPYWFLKQKVLGLLAELESVRAVEIFEVGLHEYLQGILTKLDTLNGHFYQTYFGSQQELETQEEFNEAEQ